MRAEIHTNEDPLVTELVERMNGAGDGPAAREAYREGFERLRSQLEIYPVSGRRASVIFESAAKTARNLAASCLPLGIAVAFHLFLAEMYLARVERLHQAWGLRRSAEQIMSLNELSQLRAYALRLLDDFSSGSDVQPLKKTTSAMKLRVSLMTQSTMTLLRGREDLTLADAQQLRANASELCYIKSQPTADDIILRSIGA
jgi:hypothetical protein